MSGHSKWHSIKHKKAAIDAKRGKIFNKIIKELTVAARIGGGNPEDNARLRLIIQKAKSVNMPAANIEKAIKRGTGELEGVSYEEAVYEGYGPGGTAVMIETLTDNKNRTTAEIRSIFSKNGGNLGENGCVSWMFTRKGMITVKSDAVEEDKLFEIVVDAGAEDLKKDDESGMYEITCEPESLESVKESLDKNNIPTESAEITMIPQNLVKIEEPDKAKQMARLLMTLEDHDDVNAVHTNADMDSSVFEGL